MPHNVLNAKFHEREAEIVAQAGRRRRGHHRHQHGRPRHGHLAGRQSLSSLARDEVAKATGEPEQVPETYLERFQRAVRRAEKQEVLSAGGLHVLGTERHESRRIDNQLRGRTGRQGDPGSSRFFLSLQDELMRIFAIPSASSGSSRWWA